MVDEPVTFCGIN
jgi:hypothetical protein